MVTLQVDSSSRICACSLRPERYIKTHANIITLSSVWMPLRLGHGDRSWMWLPDKDIAHRFTACSSRLPVILLLARAGAASWHIGYPIGYNNTLVREFAARCDYLQLVPLEDGSSVLGSVYKALQTRLAIESSILPTNQSYRAVSHRKPSLLLLSLL